MKYDPMGYKPQDAAIKLFLSEFCRVYNGRNRYYDSGQPQAVAGSALIKSIPPLFAVADELMQGTPLSTRSDLRKAD